jgi:hypothetical protein
MPGSLANSLTADSSNREANSCSISVLLIVWAKVVILSLSGADFTIFNHYMLHFACDGD